ncbi:MAG TPA: hypothetical protein VJA23_03425 [Candidatus Nanoarchaeia archaeon]|nr:hypothetical protein [Candidatus Nanoarchaeia archaeon]
MAQEIHVIVHPGVVLSSIDRSPKARAVWENIQRIINCGEYFKVYGDPNQLPADLPAPYPELTVLVSGGMASNCVEKQVFALGEAGYRARTNYPACYDYNFDSHSY